MGLMTKRDRDPGVPEALPTTVAMVRERLGPEALDRLWLFPPIVRGRREWGLVAASCFVEENGERSERRRLFTAPYVAERTGRGLVIEPSLSEEGEAPPDRFPRVMEGVVRRTAQELGDPREIAVAGDAEVLAGLLDELGWVEPPAQAAGPLDAPTAPDTDRSPGRVGPDPGTEAVTP